MLKISKQAAQYTAIANAADHCGECRYFEVLAAKHCTRVEGNISPSGWCKLFARKHTMAVKQ